MNTRAHKRFPATAFTQDQIGRLAIGVTILLGLAIGYFVTDWGYLILVAMALKLIHFGFTGECGFQRWLTTMNIPRANEHVQKSAADERANHGCMLEETQKRRMAQT